MFKVNHNNSTNNTINIREISHYLVKKIHCYLVRNKEVQVSYYNIKYTNFWSLVYIQQ